jgi:excisionase family DNA binding protein
MTLKETAEYLKVKPRTVYNLTSKRKIPSVKMPGGLRFIKEDIDAEIEKYKRN